MFKKCLKIFSQVIIYMFENFIKLSHLKNWAFSVPLLVTTIVLILRFVGVIITQTISWWPHKILSSIVDLIIFVYILWLITNIEIPD